MFGNPICFCFVLNGRGNERGGVLARSGEEKRVGLQRWMDGV